jgi:hypothetical protein
LESPGGHKKRRTPKKGAQLAGQQRSRVVEQFLPTDVSHIQKESSALKDALVYFVPSPRSARFKKADLEEMVARLGGKVAFTASSPIMGYHLLVRMVAPTPVHLIYRASHTGKEGGATTRQHVSMLKI